MTGLVLESSESKKNMHMADTKAKIKWSHVLYPKMEIARAADL